MKKILIGLILLCILLSGCGTINIRQKLYRDGTFDLSMEVLSDNVMFINLVKEGFQSSQMQQGTLIEQTNGFTYYFEKITFDDFPVQEDAVEFIDIEREFKFPFYYYTITLVSPGVQQTDMDLGTMGMDFGTMGMAFNYILEPFGKIKETNGMYLGENKKQVLFNLMQTGTYYVTFRDFFLSSWIGGASRVTGQATSSSGTPPGLIAFLAVNPIIIGIALYFIMKYEKKQNPRSKRR